MIKAIRLEAVVLVSAGLFPNSSAEDFEVDEVDGNDELEHGKMVDEVD